MWYYKGFEIAISGEKFRTQIDGKPATGASLTTVKKAIDKHLDAQAEDESINLPVVRCDGYVHEQKVVDDAITGIDITEPEVLFGLGKMRYGTILPATDENRTLLTQSAEAARVAKKLRRQVQEREIDTFLGRHGRTKVTLADAKARLLANYEDAVKVSQEVVKP